MAVNKEALNSALGDYQSLKPRQAVKESHKDLKQLKGEFKTAKKLKVSPDKLEQAKAKYKLQKRVYSHQIKRNGGTRKRKVVRRGYQTTRQVTESALNDQEGLSEIVSSRRKIRHSHTSIEQSKRMAKYTRKIAKKTAGSGYGVANRTYNLSRGRGFTKTPKAERLGANTKRKLRKRRARLKNSKAGKATQATMKMMRWASKPFLIILKNPLSLKAYGIGFLMILILAVFMRNPTPMQQDEFELNKAWLHLSQRDREKSTDKVDYWTNIDDVMTYMNYRFEDYELDNKWQISKEASANEGKTYKDALSTIWDSLNSDTEDLKTMKSLYSPDSKSAWLMLSKDDREEYEELLEDSKEEGYYSDYQELSNLLYKEGDVSHSNPLVITKRFGYSSKDKIYNKSIIEAKAGQTLYAVMSGAVEVKEDSLIIKTDDAIFTYGSVSGLRVKSGDTVTEGQELGTVKDGNGIEVSYQKLEEKATKKEKAKWTYVNVGFYFPSVTYSQTTSVMTDLNLEGDLAKRAKASYDYLKKKIPNATDNGIASMFGNFATESSITAKRAEGDYLKPPVGASASSWDDEAWLALGGPSIYNGGYPNVLHRGLGLGQWTDTADGANRHTLLLNYAKSKNKKWYDLELQLDFIFEGDNPYYQEIARSILTSNEDVSVLTKRFLNNWEGNSGDKLLERQNNAKQMLNFFKAPKAGGSGTMASSWDFPEAYRDKLKNPPSTNAMRTQAGNGYPQGQCTWYAYNRLMELGSITASGGYSFLGNGQNWVSSLASKGWKTSPLPKAGAVVSTLGGFDGTMAQYGHVAIVEVVNPDGSFLISECNYNFVQDKVHYRVCRPAPYYSFAIPK
ncbi:phage tail tip lysozyme [Streptococcus iniae]|nr:CHAP domain-containing protein [Streptococcus iniae]OHX26180.1 CHAP domain-containing protein [Streptococcus iniae]